MVASSDSFVDLPLHPVYFEGVFTRTGLRALHGWTHERLDLLLAHAGLLTPEQFVAEIPGFGRATVRDQLSHIIQCEQFWVHGLQQIPWKSQPDAEFTTIASLTE